MSRLNEYRKKREEIQRELRDFDEKIRKIESAARKLIASYNIGEINYDEYKRRYAATFRDKTPEQWIAHYNIRINSHRSQLDWYSSQIKKLSRTSSVEIKQGLGERIRAAEENKKKIIDEVQKLAARYADKEISYAEYQNAINEKYPDKSPQQWVDYYDVYIRNCKNLAVEAESKAKKQKIKSFSMKFILPVMLFAFLFLGLVALQKFDITGFAVEADKETHTDILGISTNESTEYQWNISNPGKINWAKITGDIEGRGNVKIYLDDLLILDSSDLEEETAPRGTLTGFASEGAEDSNSDSGDDGSDSGSESSSSDSDDDSGSGDSEGTGEENGDTGNSEDSGIPTNEEEGPSSEESDSGEPSEEPVDGEIPEESAEDNESQDERNETETQVPEETNQTEVEAPVESNETSEPEEEPVIAPEEGTTLSFEEYCDETCDMADFDSNRTSYVIRIEVTNAVLSLETIIYEIEKTGQELIPENVTAEELILNRTTKQYKAIINRPVKWVTALNVTNKTDESQMNVEIPKESQNISVKTGEEARAALDEADEFEELIDNSEREDLATGLITGNVALDIRKEKGILTRFYEFVTGFTITGNVIAEENLSENIIETEDSKIVDLESILSQTEDTDVAVEYYTDAPIAVETTTSSGKTVTVSGPDELNYTDILAFAEIPEVVSVENAKEIRIFWKEEGRDIEFDYYDLDENGFVDYVEWIVPHLSNQTFNIILITKADHLDENREFISDVYNATFALDGVWSEAISEGHYVRVTFEVNLTADRDITVFPRAVNGTPRIEIYEMNGSEMIAEFSMLNDNEYNKVYLTGLSGSQDVFDLKILNGSVEFDHIIDPAGNTLTSDGSCGSNCNYAEATYEPASDNTVDSCTDGGNAADNISSCLYMWVQDIFIDNLDSNTDFATGDNVSVTCDMKCYSTGTEYSVAYNNGSGWQVVSYGNCPSGPSYNNAGGPSCPNNRVNITTTRVLDNVVGEHTFRCQEAWSMAATSAERICDDADAYQDADDINLTVIASVDISAPRIIFSGATPDEGNVSENYFTVNLDTSDESGYYSFVEHDNDLLLWMRMDEVNSTGHPGDSSSYSRNGTKVNQASQSSLGKFNSSFTFDGTGDKIVVSDSSSLGFNLSDFTLSAWFNSTDLTTTNEGILGKWGGSSYYYCSLWESDDKLRCYINLGGGNMGPISTSALTASQWYHMAFVVDRDGYATLYLNGAKQSGTLDISSYRAVSMTGGQFAIGGIGNDLSTFDFKGHIDDVLVFNRSLSQEEIASLYNSAASEYSHEFADLDEGNHTFTGYAIDVLSYKNQTEDRVIEVLAADTATPLIDFANPTPFAGSAQSFTSAPVNLSTSDETYHYSFMEHDRDVLVWLTMDNNGSGTTFDRSSYNRTVYNQGTNPLSIDITSGGKFGNKTNFPGVDQYIRINDDAGDTLELSNGGSVSIWFNPKEWGDVVRTSGNNDWQIRYTYGTRQNQIQFVAGNVYSYTDQYTILNNEWNHVVVVFNSTGRKIYINGVDKTYTGGNETALPYDSSYGITVGLGSSYFNGSIDDFIVFNRSLTLPEVQALYNATAYQYFNNFTNLAVQNHTFTGHAVDKWGNINQTSARTIKIDQTNPLISFETGTPSDASSQANHDMFVNLSTSDTTSNHYSLLDFDNDLLLWMRFDDRNSSGSPVDISSYSKNGSLVGNAGIQGSGAFGDSLGLDGTDDYVELGTQSEHYSPADSVTISAWIYPSSATQNDDAYILQNPNYQLFNVDTGTDIQFKVFNLSGSSTVSSASYSQNVWTHFIGVYNGTHTLIYKNGVLQDSDYLGGNIRTNSGLTRIGTSSSQYWNGNIDEVMIFNRSLSATEITALYNASAAQYSRNFTNLDYGNHIFEGYAVDKAGNKNQTDERTVTVLSPDSEPPLISFGTGTPADDSSQANSAIFVNVSSTDDSRHYSLLDFDSDLLLWMRMENAIGEVSQDAELEATSNCSSGSLAYDENFATGSTHISGSCVIYVNYTIPSGVFSAKDEIEVTETTASTIEFNCYNYTSSSFVNIGNAPSSHSLLNYTVPAGCLAGEKLQLYFTMSGTVSQFNEDRVWWNRTYADDSSYDQLGDAEGTQPILEDGFYGNSYSFDGTDDHIKISTTGLLDLSNNKTFSFWVNQPTYQGGEVALLASGDDSIGISDTVAGALNYRHQFDSCKPISTTVISDGAWHHVIVMRVDSNITMYIDGALDKSVACAPSGAVNSPLYLAAGDGALSGLFYDGFIDELMIFNRSLSATEIAALYNSSVSQYSRNFTGLADGTHMFTGYAVDAEGNKNQTEERSVDISVNDAPQLIYVSPISNQNPTEDSVTTVQFVATAYDPDGTNDIHHVIIEGVTRDGETTRGSDVECSAIVGQTTSTTANYSCEFDMWYFDESGNWNVSATTGDTLGLESTNDSTYFQYNLLKAMVLSPSSVTWNDVGAGQFNKTASNDPTFINNTGNYDLQNISITGRNLHGDSTPSYYIGVGNISVDIDTGSLAECSGGTMMINGTAVNITSAVLNRGNHSLNDGSTGQEQLYYCITSVPVQLPTQTYSTNYGGAWKITILVGAFVAGRRKKRKKVNLGELKNYLGAKYGLTISQLLELVERTKKLSIPLEIFSRGLSPAEAVCKYMKENLGMNYHEIAGVLNRDERTVWVNYRNSKSISEKFEIKKDEISVPADIFADRRLSISESVVLYLSRSGKKNVEISLELGKDPRNVFTIYSRAKKKIASVSNRPEHLSQIDEIQDALQSEFGITISDIKSMDENIADIPVEIFSRGLSPAEAVCKYMKENLGMNYHEIAGVLNRDERTVWVNYRNSVRKQSNKALVDEGEPLVPAETFGDRSLTIYEAIVLYLRTKGLTNSEIAHLLRKDPRNVFTIYSRAVKKSRDKIYKV